MHLCEGRLWLVIAVWQKAANCAATNCLRLWSPLEFNYTSQDSVDEGLYKLPSNFWNLFHASFPIFFEEMKMPLLISMKYFDWLSTKYFSRILRTKNSTLPQVFENGRRIQYIILRKKAQIISTDVTDLHCQYLCNFEGL